MKLNIMTLNVWGFSWPLARDRNLRYGRINKHLSLTHYDIVALQEVWTNASRIIAGGLWWVKRPEEFRLRGLRISDSGLGLLVSEKLRDSTRPLAADGFARHRGWDRVKNKGYYIAIVDCPDGPFLVCNTHLQAGRGHAAIRLGQIQEICDFLSSYELPCILLGDFNLEEEEEHSVALLNRAGFFDTAATLEQAELITCSVQNPYNPKSQHPARYDRVYYKDGPNSHWITHSLAIVAADPPFSDHELVTAELSLIANGDEK